MLRFEPTPLEGAWLLIPERLEDERGFFARTWCRREFGARGLSTAIAQCSVSFNHRAGVLRGMHYQAPPHSETKIVRCTRGAIFDVIVDLRPASRTFRRWFGAELTADNHRMLYVPDGFAHGFQTLVDCSEVFYQISAFYEREAAHGVRWNDPAFGIEWPPAGERIISARDRAYEDFVW